MKLEKPNA